jgi:hypothetical protein
MFRILFALMVALAATAAFAAEMPIPRNVIENALRTADCSATYEDATAHLDPPHDLGDGQKLQEFLCRKSEYQYSGIFLAYEDSAPERARLLAFSFPKVRGFESRHSVTSPQFDGKDKSLTSLDKGRANSVCGSAGEWKWNGHDFVLVKYWLKVDCNKGRFDPKGRPKDWLIFPKK